MPKKQHSVNKVILIGELEAEPEVKLSSRGIPVARLSLATDPARKELNRKGPCRSEWQGIVAWNRLAEICGEYLTRGTLIYVEGRLHSRCWEDRYGSAWAATEVVADKLVILSAQPGEVRPQRNAVTQACCNTDLAPKALKTSSRSKSKDCSSA